MTDHNLEVAAFLWSALEVTYLKSTPRRSPSCPPSYRTAYFIYLAWQPRWTGSRNHSEILALITTAKRFDTTLIQVKIARFFVATYSENR